MQSNAPIGWRANAANSRTPCLQPASVCGSAGPPLFPPPQGKKDTPMFFVPTRPLSQPFPAHPPVPSACMFRTVAENSWGGEAERQKITKSAVFFPPPDILPDCEADRPVRFRAGGIWACAPTTTPPSLHPPGTPLRFRPRYG